ncbi:hypothetical protein NDI56_00190 [Haloarcula sp. S1CR25-12]|uniref:Secreted glycoprotein n=1 Tax=Haloarcula saliterrae TaxID=2950534 RepID=A0ABU2F6D3_9EURY|nr:BGTF surface domain-containing protein [Haloarcula sp. S1CR25-12]MDS0257819.1 hypothetical protein [Haloarcula sp. S1CR25-12]
MRRREYVSASAALLTVGAAGCSQLTGQEGETNDSTSTATSSSTADGGTPTDGESPSAQLQYEGDALTLDNASEQQIRGTSNLDPGTGLEIQLDSETASDPFVKLPETTVQDGGEFSATVDMSNNDEGSEFTVEVIHDGETLTEADGQVV